MAAKSAGILAFIEDVDEIRYLLVHPGGPFYKSKDKGAWSIPKGEYLEGEDVLAAAIREFEEELGINVDGDFLPLNPVKQKSGKTVTAWAIKVQQRLSLIYSNTFSMEWPPHSGKMQEFPEVDKAEWFTYDEAVEKLLPAQLPMLQQLAQTIKGKR